MRETTNDLLSLTGAEVHTAASGREAYAFLTQLQSAVVDLVITDLAMPNGDGHWLLAQIRAQPQISQLRVVIMSAHVQAESIEAGLKAGADGYIVKPYDPAQFIDTVEKHLAKVQSNRTTTSSSN